MDDPEIAVVLKAYEAFARGDAAAATADMDPEVEWIEPLSFPGGGRRIGPAAVTEYLEDSRASWKHLTSKPTATRVGPEIVVVHRLHGILLDGTPNAIAALFTPDGTYQIEPWQIQRGREEIVAGWLEHADKPGDTSFHWWHVARDYANLWLIELDDEGRARSFAEWWKEFPEGE